MATPTVMSSHFPPKIDRELVELRARVGAYRYDYTSIASFLLSRPAALDTITADPNDARDQLDVRHHQRLSSTLKTP